MLDIMSEQLLAQIYAHEPVELAQQLIRIPSFLWHKSEIGYWIADWMRRRDFEAELQEVPLRNGGVIHQTVGRLTGDGSGPSLLLCDHMDTSDWQGRPFREDEWKHDPLAARSRMANDQNCSSLFRKRYLPTFRDATP